MATHPDLQCEQEYIDRAYDRLETMRATVSERLQSALGQSGGSTPQARAERDIVVRNALQRLEQLDIGSEPLCFGRIDRATDDGNGNGSGDTFYIGRLAVSGADQEPLVVDWRAPVAEPFYRATGRHPMGLRRRRHFSTEGRRVVGIEDELFASDGAEGDGDLELAGPGALLAALERSRSGRMRDIVATVQREQDEIIRAPLAGVLVVQGGPGTGKTAVALHRAAYLLYTHRFPLEQQGVLVVGPNPVFLRYIDQVLPSLGETGVALATVDRLVDGPPVRGTDRRDAARVKGDPRMARLLARAVRDRERGLPADVTVPYGPYSLRLTKEASAEVVAAVKRRGGPHNPRRRQVEAMVLDRLHRDYQQSVERIRRTAVRSGAEDASAAAREDFGDDVRRQPELVAALDRMWPVLSPEEFLHDLFGARALLNLAARGVLDDAEVAALHRPRSAGFEEIPWTSADLPLLDEARVLLGPRRRRHDDAGTFAYGHIVVDEAQDLSPMQLRVLGRRSLGSMTVVGDVAQATGQWAPREWGEVLEHLPTKRGANVVELSVNYRTPGEVMDFATHLLPIAAPGVRPPRSVRRTGEEPTLVQVDGSGVPSAAAAAAGREAAAVGHGSVAVVVPSSMIQSVANALARAGVRFGEPDRSGLDETVTLVAVELVKGLEFDSVVVVEPARLAREAAQGMRALFVALTRPTRRLTVVHSEPLPDPLR